MDALFRSLNKGQLAPVYYFHGPEDVLKDEAVRTILDKALDPGLRDLNLDQRSAAQVDPDEVHALCNTLPMMAERRVVLLRDIEAWKRKTKSRSAFLRYLDRPSPQTLVILVQGSGDDGEDRELARGSYEVRFDGLPPERAVNWVLHQAGRLGLNLETAAADHLVRSVGSDLGALSSELAKLASLPADAPVTAERVGELLGVRQGETPWDWRTAVLEGDSGRSVALLPAILAQPGVSGVKLLSALGTSLIGLAIARTLYDEGVRGQSLEEAVVKALFRMRPSGLLGYKSEAAVWARVVTRWPADRIRAALRASTEADQALKSTTISDERGVLTDLVLRIGLGPGGSGEGGRSDRSKITRRMAVAARGLFVASALSALSAFSVLSAQTDPRLVEVIRHAQEGEGDSARVKVERLLATTSPSDTLYPQIVYTQAMVASDAAEMRRQLQRVAVEHSSSSWADDALLRLVQLDYASANLAGAARNLERLRLDYPGSLLLPQASYWAARTYFDQKKPELACRWISEGMGGSSSNIELQNQLAYLNQRCTQLASAGAQVPRDTAAGVPAPAAPPEIAAAPQRDTLPAPAALPDSSPPAPSTTQPPAPTPTPPLARSPVPSRDTVAAPRPTAGGTHFRIQITAVRSPATARSMATRLKSRGFDVVTVEEGGLYKVRVGEYPTKADAIAALPDIKAKLGGSPFVVAEL
jgi:DNA polymerase-3 subunit delta